MHIHDLQDLPVAALGVGTAIEKRMLAGSDDVPHVMQFVRATFAPGQVAPAHAHADWSELFYVESGEGTLTVDGTAHALRAGIVFTVEPGERHEIVSGPASHLVVIYVSIRH